MRILAGHPEAHLAYLASDHAAGKRLADVLPALGNELDAELKPTDTDAIAASCDVCFLAKKGPDSMEHAPRLLEKGVRCIDIGGEFRLRSAEEYEKWYGNEHTCPDLLERARYWLTELFREEIRGAELVANPGCYPTSCALAAAPFLKKGLVEPEGMVFDSYSGLSGAGRQYSARADNLFVSCHENLRAYAVGTHKHTPEIEQVLRGLSGADVRVAFVPHLAPLDRGILTTMYARVARAPGEPVKVLKEFYADEPFVRVTDDPAEVRTSRVRGTNFCDLGAAYIEKAGLLVVLGAIDNTVKGAGGQAVQNMNVMFGIAETAGLVCRSV